MNDVPSREVEVFAAALQLPPPERADYLKAACNGDTGLRERVERLLEAHDGAGNFLEQPPADAQRKAGMEMSVGEKPGDRIGRYKLLQQIGEGGCGVVFMAEQEEPVRRRVALKIIKPGMDTRSVMARFEAERQALAMMDHPNIAKVFDAGATESGRPYFVMELVRGVKIVEYCDNNSLTTKDRLGLFVKVCRAVQHAHQKGIIHRDIKPSNILVTTSLEGSPLPVVIDFGIAKATTNQRLTDKTLFTAFEMLIGTPAYMSPEQAELSSVDVDTRTDIYSLGVLLYELLTGSTPFDGTALMKAGLDEIRRVIREKEPQRPSTRLNSMTAADLTATAQRRNSAAPILVRSVRGDLDWIVMKALEKDRTRRYETATGLALDVQRFLSNEPVSARPPSAVYKFQKLAMRNKLLFGAIALITILLVIGLVIVTASLSRERQARRQAQTEEARSLQVTKFLKDMLKGVGPSVARGRDTTMLREILDQTAERIGRDIGDQPAVEADLRSLIGRLYLQIGNYDHAEKMHRAALALYRKLTGPASEETAAALNDLGAAFWLQRKLPEAENAYLEALAIRKSLFGNIHPDVATSLNGLAGVYRRERKLSESETLTREALDIRRTLFGQESLEVADSLHNLSVVLGDRGKRPESEEIAREALAMRQRILGNEDPVVAQALVDVAWAAGFNGKTGEAESFEEKALVMQRKLLGDDHPDVARSLSALGERIRQQGNLTESHGVLAAALSIQRKLLGNDHPATLDSIRSLGWTLEGEGKWTEAEIAHREALAAWRKKAANDDPAVLSSSESLVRTLIAQKKFAEADQILQDVLTPDIVQNSSSANLLVLRVDLMGRRGRWREAARDAALLIRYQPSEHYRYHTLAPLLAITSDRPAYEEFCRKIPIAFPSTSNPYLAERMAKDCLLRPISDLDWHWLDGMTDTVIALGNDESAMPFFQTTMALSNYRKGRFPQAIEWAEKSLGRPEVYANAHAYAILAMAHGRLGQAGEARTMLEKGEALAPKLNSQASNEDIGSGWMAWLFARIALDEAAELIAAENHHENPK
jgi:serine/threonine protein kinase/tetratricopeptide (TPR) repeat protein